MHTHMLHVSEQRSPHRPARLNLWLHLISLTCLDRCNGVLLFLLLRPSLNNRKSSRRKIIPTSAFTFHQHLVRGQRNMHFYRSLFALTTNQHLYLHTWPFSLPHANATRRHGTETTCIQVPLQGFSPTCCRMFSWPLVLILRN